MLYYILLYLYPDSNPPVDWAVMDSFISYWNLPVDRPTEEQIASTAESSEFKEWYADRRSREIDTKTGAAIRNVLHPFCGSDESDAIIRDQLVQILNALGIEPTAEFARLNQIAITEIEKGRLEKEALDA